MQVFEFLDYVVGRVGWTLLSVSDVDERVQGAFRIASLEELMCDRRTASRCSGLRYPTSSSSWSARTGASVGGLPLRGPRIIALRALTEVGFLCCRRMNCGKTLTAASALKVNSSLFVLMAPAKTCRAGFKVSMKAWFEAAGRSSSVLDLKLANCAINLC